MLAAGDEALIPAERTSTGVAYGTVFDAAEELLTSVDHDDLRTVTSELGTSLRGQGDELRRILRNTTDKASAFAERKDEIAQLAGELTALTRLLEIGRAHFLTPVTNENLVCRLLFKKKI